MPFLIIGILIGMPLGVVAFFKFMADANEAGRKSATADNLKKQAEQEAKWKKLNY
jgi:F0F1-type ATP synthase assembly protein I